MTELLQKAFTEASKLPAEEQDKLASRIIEELSSEQVWAEAFAASEDVLERLAEEALAEEKAGRTLALDPDRL